MATSPAFRPVVTAAVEGLTDEAVAERLINHAGGKLGNVHGRRGKGFLRRQIDGYGQAARRSPWLVLVDLDMDAECPVGLVRIWLEKPGNTFLCFRVAVREVESWLLADRETLAAYLRVRSGRIPSNPERLEDPKRVMIDVASRSTSRAIREDMGRGREKGRRRGNRSYARRLAQYVHLAWRPDVAAQHSESLARTVGCLQRVVREYAEAVS